MKRSHVPAPNTRSRPVMVNKSRIIAVHTVLHTTIILLLLYVVLVELHEVRTRERNNTRATSLVPTGERTFSTRSVLFVAPRFSPTSAGIFYHSTILLLYRPRRDPPEVLTVFFVIYTSPWRTCTCGVLLRGHPIVMLLLSCTIYRRRVISRRPTRRRSCRVIVI